MRNFFPQKYSQYLGDAGRSACGHYIDPQDVHALSSDRFVMALVTRGTTGTACAGVVQFVVLQANCAAPQLYQLSTRADRR